MWPCGDLSDAACAAVKAWHAHRPSALHPLQDWKNLLERLKPKLGGLDPRCAGADGSCRGSVNGCGCP